MDFTTVFRITLVVGIAGIPVLYWFFVRNGDQEQSEEPGPDRGQESTTKMPRPSQGNRLR